MESVNFLIPSKCNSIESFNSSTNRSGSDYNSSSSSLNISNPTLYFNPESVLYQGSIYNPRTYSNCSHSRKNSYSHPHSNSYQYITSHSNDRFHNNYTYENKNERKSFKNKISRNKSNRDYSVEYNFDDDLPLENDLGNGNSIKRFSILESAIKSNMISSIEDNINTYSNNVNMSMNNHKNRINEDIIEINSQDNNYLDNINDSNKTIKIEVVSKDDEKELSKYSDKFIKRNTLEENYIEGNDYIENGRKNHIKYKRNGEKKKVGPNKINESGNFDIDSNHSLNRYNYKCVSIGSFNPQISNDELSTIGNNHFTYHIHHHHIHHDNKTNSHNEDNAISEEKMQQSQNKQKRLNSFSSDSHNQYHRHNINDNYGSIYYQNPRRRSFHEYDDSYYNQKNRSRSLNIHDGNNDFQYKHQRRRSSFDNNFNSEYNNGQRRRRSMSESQKHDIKDHLQRRKYSNDKFNKYYKSPNDDDSSASDNSRHGFKSRRSSVSRRKENISSGYSINSNDNDNYHCSHHHHSNLYHDDSPTCSRFSNHHHHRHNSTSNSYNSINNYYDPSISNSRNNINHHLHNIHSHTSLKASISSFDNNNNNNSNNNKNSISSNILSNCYRCNNHYQQYQNQYNSHHNNLHHHHSNNVKISANDNTNNNSGSLFNVNNQNNVNSSREDNNLGYCNVNIIDNNNLYKNTNNFISNSDCSNDNIDVNINNSNNEIKNNQYIDENNNNNQLDHKSSKQSVDFEKSIIINALNNLVLNNNDGIQLDRITDMDVYSSRDANTIDNKYPDCIKTAVGNIIVEICDSNDDRNDEFVKIEEILDDEENQDLKDINNNKNLNIPIKTDKIIPGSFNNYKSPLLIAIDDGDDLDEYEKSIDNLDSCKESNDEIDDVIKENENDIMRKSKSAPLKMSVGVKNDIDNILLYSPFYSNDFYDKKDITDDFSESLQNNSMHPNDDIGTKKIDNRNFYILNKIKSFIPISEFKKRKNTNCITLKGGFENKLSKENGTIVPFTRSLNMDIKNKKLDDLIKYPEHSYNSILNMKMFIFNELNDREKREIKANNFFIFNGEDEKDILTEDFNNNTSLLNKDENNEEKIISKRSEKGPIDINDKGKHYSSSYDGRKESIKKKSTHKSKKTNYPSITNSQDSSISSDYNKSIHSSDISSLSYDKIHHCCNGNKRYHKYNSSNESNNYINSRVSMNTNSHKNRKIGNIASMMSGLTSRTTYSHPILNGDSEAEQNNGIYRHHHRRHHHHHHHHHNHNHNHNHKAKHKKNDMNNCSSNFSSFSNNKKENMKFTSDTNTSSSSETTSSSSLYTPSCNYSRNNIDYRNQYASMNSTNQSLSNLPKTNKISKKEKELYSSSQLFSEFVPIECASNSRSSYLNVNYNTNNGSSRNVSNSHLFNNENGPLFGFNSNMNVIPEVEVVKTNVLSRVNVSEIPEITEQEDDELREEDNDIFESRDFSEIYNPVIDPSKVKAKSDIHLLNRFSSTQRIKGSLNSVSQFLHLPKNLKTKVVSSPSKFETNYFTISYRKAIPKSEWKPDNSTVHCTICNKKFSFFIRRHHCRLCGYIFCSSCCYRMVPLIIDDNNTNSERVKKYLHNVFSSNASSITNNQSSDKFKGSSASECLSSILEIYQNKNNFLVCPIPCKICENCYTKYYIN
ncbi:hypothetical protein BCR36DRAFT_328477 [Piromyces finnis]|uniref:FYVE-type domain-containing protein n=1 Tax=Piromyces finnis TaxID=1754191 RepID=A0A1Y1V7S9_9FUNG|nr:hypothetical protein BCR36DRAFT_328477 [Piromyces finnis]|eukprot:ORX49346.1 hypothetical protein BCR36DRAFT_328477 [Piromyces finnis]